MLLLWHLFRFKGLLKPKTIFNEQIQLPTNTQIDQRLIVGAFIFGIGWGIAGICPAPALTLIGLDILKRFILLSRC